MLRLRRRSLTSKKLAIWNSLPVLSFWNTSYTVIVQKIVFKNLKGIGLRKQSHSDWHAAEPECYHCTGLHCRRQFRGHTTEFERPLHLIRVSLVSSRFKQSPGSDETVRSGRSLKQSPSQTKQSYSWLEFTGFSTLTDRTPVLLYKEIRKKPGSRQFVSQIGRSNCSHL